MKSLKNGNIYTGFTYKDVQVRLLEHNTGSNQWTRENGPLMLLYYESYICEEDAKARESFYKNGFGRKIRDAILSTVESASARG